MTTTNNFLSICIFVITLWNFTHSTMESKLIANYSKNFLLTVPGHLSTRTAVLDLSHNTISKLEISHFRSLSNLQVLFLSHNIIRELDFGVFQHNKILEHLDLSHNQLWNVSGLPNKSLRSLDLTYNDFITISLSAEFTKTSKLNYFGISTRKLSSVSAVLHLQLDTLFLDLEDLYEYKPGSLPMFNANTVRIVFPRNAKFRTLLDLQVNGTESLELSKIPLDQMEDLRTFLSKLNKRSTLLNLTIIDTRCSWRDLVSIFKAVGKSSINHLTILYPTITTFDAGPFKDADFSLKSLTIKYAVVETATLDQSIVYTTFSNMNLDSLTISDCGILFAVCPEKPSRFKYLCFENNTLTDTMLEGCKNLNMLQTFLLQKNRLEDLTKMSLMTTSMRSLNYMDISQNHLYYKNSKDTSCKWGEHIAKLNLSSNKLTDSVFKCLPNNIQILDLQSNHISAVPKDIMELAALEELNLASNRLSAFPGCGHFRNLHMLNVENNFVLDQFSEFLQTCQNIQRLKGGNNPFTCNCDLRPFINLQKQESVELVGWPDVYKCDYPSSLRETLLKDFHVSELECNVTLMITVVLVVALFVIAVVAFLCIRFDVPWYFKMIWRWSQVKHRIWKNKSEEILENIQYHAFVSYSEHDSNWVKTELIPSLEKEDGSLKICRHERNFVAGKSIVENIIDCIEKSFKSIFVLSPNFVQSEWCHYELYFAHHKLFSENADGLILILLEPIPAYIIPARYYKLKALMAKRTYLEWPKDKRKHALFWTNLRAALQIKLSNPEEMKEL